MSLVRAQDPVLTEITVRVAAHDAKLIGDVAGGAWVEIRSVKSGRLLAEGLHAGSTGNTQQIVIDPHVRGTDRYASDGAAGFQVRLALSEPTLVEISAVGPLQPSGAALETSLQTWLIPGEDVTGDGIVLVLRGFTVEVDPVQASDGQLEVNAEVRMLCTCPLEPGGLWDSDRVSIRAALKREGRTLEAVDLNYTGETSRFSGMLHAPEAPGEYVVEVTAADASTGNFGRAVQTVVVR